MTHSPTEPRNTGLQIVSSLQSAGFEAYYAGGYVRDMLLGRNPADVDIATNATPEQIAQLFPHAKEVGKAFAVMTVIIGDQACDVATFRKDYDYQDGRRPHHVGFASASEDALRRDFTINGMFYDPIQHEIRDFVSGQADLQACMLRTIGPPEERFAEDYLRMLRAVRFASVLDFAIHPDTSKAIKAVASNIRHISVERVQQELTRMLIESPRAGKALRLLHDLGLLRFILPEIEAMAGQAQPPEYHPEGDVLEHTACMLDLMTEPTIQLAYAVLLHDVGKPPTAAPPNPDDAHPRIRFNRHAHVGADMAATILHRLRLPRHESDEIVRCVRNHMRFLDVQRMKRSTLRSMVGAPTFFTELELHRLDCLSSNGELKNYHFLQDFIHELRDEPMLPKAWISGTDVMALGIPAGPEVGRWLRTAYERQTNGDAEDPEELLSWLKGAVKAAQDE